MSTHSESTSKNCRYCYGPCKEEYHSHCKELVDILKIESDDVEDSIDEFIFKTEVTRKVDDLLDKQDFYVYKYCRPLFHFYPELNFLLNIYLKKMPFIKAYYILTKQMAYIELTDINYETSYIPWT